MKFSSYIKEVSKEKVEEFDPKELKMGAEVELEHTDDKEEAKKITMDHLREIPDYYTRLKKMEDQAKKEGKFNEI